MAISIITGRANHWSALIGASHSKNYVLWEYGGYSSDGVKQVAELGSPVKMEEEIRQKVGLWYRPALHTTVVVKIECSFIPHPPKLKTITKYVFPFANA